MFDHGSGDGVTAARAAVLPLCAISAITAPARVASNWCSGESWLVALYARNPATGTRINVCSAFQIRSKAGILSAKNSIPKRAAHAAITGQLPRRCKAGGRGKCPKRASSPKTPTVAYRFRPAAKLTAASMANSSAEGIFRTSSMGGVYVVQASFQDAGRSSRLPGAEAPGYYQASYGRAFSNFRAAG